MTAIRKLAISTIVALAPLVSVPSAHAGGWLADTFIKPISPDLARQADNLNTACGNCVDHTIAAVANDYVPGSGTALEAGWAAQHSGVLDGFNQNQPIGQPVQSGPVMSQQMVLGNRCYTPVGVSGFGPLQPVGSACNVMGPYGPIFGQVGQ